MRRNGYLDLDYFNKSLFNFITTGVLEKERRKAVGSRSTSASRV